MLVPRTGSQSVESLTTEVPGSHQFANFSSQTLNSLIFRFFLPTYAFMTINHILSSTQYHIHYRLLFFYYLALSILKFPL